MSPIESSLEVDSTSCSCLSQRHSVKHTIYVFTPNIYAKLAFVGNRCGGVHKVMLALFTKVSLLAVFLSVTDDAFTIASGASVSF